jgi:hypothetical protein
MYSLGSVSSLVSEKKIFEISANQSILLALAAILNIRLSLTLAFNHTYYYETVNTDSEINIK